MSPTTVTSRVLVESYATVGQKRRRRRGRRVQRQQKRRKGRTSKGRKLADMMERRKVDIQEVDICKRPGGREARSRRWLQTVLP